MTPLDHYKEQCKNGILSEDPEQLLVILALQQVYHHLLQEHQRRRTLLGRLRAPKGVKGLYVWGGVGIGKTCLMDIFFNSIHFPEKRRMHFHVFMQWVHQALKKHQGESDPLQVIAKEVASNTQLLCFDEFIVNDIADAMLLGRLLNALFSRGVCLVATSNMAPDDLYKKGLQRALFLPTIAMIKTHTQVMHVPIQTDYRLRHLKTAGVFFTPDNADAEENMEKCFDLLTHGSLISNKPLAICERFITIRKQSDQVVWFDFNAICHVPRSQQDYLAIANLFRTVFISHVPHLPSSANNQITLFIRMVDVFYDANVRLVLSSATTIENIYTDGPFLFDYKRTCSRLMEMQSEGYFL